MVIKTFNIVIDRICTIKNKVMVIKIRLHCLLVITLEE